MKKYSDIVSNKELEDFGSNLQLAQMICSGNYVYDDYDKFFKFIYPFATENISGYIHKFNLRNKSLLTVGSSSDQAMNAIAYGCKDITVVDTNPFVRYYYYLKVAALMNLSPDDYIKFFGTTKGFSKENYCLLRKDLKELDLHSWQFWDIIFATYKSKRVRTRLFMDDQYNGQVIKRINPYLSDDRVYGGMKAKLNGININFINTNIFNVNDEKKYDNIWLSNIADFLTVDEIKQLFMKLNNCLSDNGRMLIRYLYGDITNSNANEVKKALKQYKIDLLSFQGMPIYNDDSANDSILLYHKVKGK